MEGKVNIHRERRFGQEVPTGFRFVKLIVGLRKVLKTWALLPTVGLKKLSVSLNPSVLEVAGRLRSLKSRVTCAQSTVCFCRIRLTTPKVLGPRGTV